MRDLPAALEAELEGRAYGICRLIEIRRKSGALLRLAEHQANLTVDGDVSTRARGFRVSSLPFVINAVQTNVVFEVAVIDDGSIDPDDLRNGLYDSAAVQISACSHLIPANGKIKLFKGNFAGIEFSDTGLASIGVEGLLSRTRRLLIEHYSPMCRTWFGDERCKVPLAPLTQAGTVTSISGYNIVISGTAASAADDYWNLGLIIPTSGQGVGDAWEIRDWITSSNVVKTYIPAVGKISAGDSVNLIPGCDFTRGAKGCGRWNNIINYRGEPYVPGQDAGDITYSDWGAT